VTRRFLDFEKAAGVDPYGARRFMKLAWILWLSQLLPQPAADSLCLSTTVYLEARDQTLRGQQAVAEVALRRLDSGLWGNSMCQVVTARKQFAPTIVAPGTKLRNPDAWDEAVKVAVSAQRNWALPVGERIAPAISLPTPLPARAGAIPTRWQSSAITPSTRCSRSNHVPETDPWP
jgi:spore germination cell wall hydrolase CwlJ-like protein